MEREGLDQRLSKVSTLWTMLRQAQGAAPESAEARRILMERYGGAVRRYLRVALPAVEADDVAQEFALSLVRGDFHNADPQRGRFRDYVKTILFNLVSKHRKRQQRLPLQLALDGPDPQAPSSPPADFDADFVAGWRDELLARTWSNLEVEQPALYAVLRFRTANPDMPSGDLAERLSEQAGKPMSAAGVRQALHRARACFADLLLDEVARTLEQPGLDAVERELEELELLPYCRPALERKAQGR